MPAPHSLDRGASTVVDSILFRDAFGTPRMREIFSDGALIARYIEVEVALARAEARCGVIPQQAADAIAKESRLERIDFDHLREETDIVGYPILPLVHQLVAMCGDAGRYVHWGATTQDIMDTANALQIRAALDLVDADIRELRGILAALAKKHRDTPMAGRTHLQQALPVTFGYKVAIWLAMFDRHQERLAQLRERVLVVSFAGAAGTLASLGTEGFAVQKALAEELKLGVPATTWHVARDGFAETVNLLALITGSLGKIALDVMIMASTEFGELYEPFVKGRGASSTMPQKRNPISSCYIHAQVSVVRQHAAALMDAMIADHERSTGPWEIEWIVLPEAFCLMAGALKQSRFILEGLEVDAAQMRANIDLTGGLVMSEAVMMGLGKYIGREYAHDLVYDICRVAVKEKRPLLDLLCEHPEINRHLDRAALAALCDPANYLGQSGVMVDRVLAKLR
jgi:3-carboxy-cis,cis-muconate cycloisomerase